MRPLRAWFVRFAGMFRKARRDGEFAAELDSHLQFHVEENLERGLSPDEARRRALVALGGIEPAKEAYRDRRGLPLLETFTQDVRFGLRMLRKNPGFTAVAILTLALGIGASTAIFSVVNAVLLRPLPFREPDRLVSLWQTNLGRGAEVEAVSPANFLDWRDDSPAFEEMVAIGYWSFDYTGKGEPEAFTGELVTKDCFHLLGASAAIGRTFLPEEYEEGKEHVVMFSHGLWERRFGSDPSIVGQTISLRDETYTVVGILPADFHLPWLGEDREVYAPMQFTPQMKSWRGAGNLQVMARLKPGVTADQARAMLARTAARLSREYPTENGSVGAALRPLDEQMVHDIRPTLWLLSAAVGIVLLIACANVANLLLVRGSQRGRELAIRTSVGAARSRVVRQLLTENLVLGALGCTGGLLLARWSLKIVLSLRGTEIPRLDQTTIDWRVLAFGIVLGLATVLLFGLAPALQVTRRDLHAAARRRTWSAGFGRRQGLRGLIATSQVALALTMLAGTGLLLRSLVNLLHVDPGYSGEHVVGLQVFAWGRYTNPAQRAAYFKDAVRSVSTVPGVEIAGATSGLPLLFGGPDATGRFSIEDRPPLRPDQMPTAIQTVVTPAYFATLGVRLVRGRLFSDFDSADSPRVVLINQTMASRYWPGEDPIGKHILVRLFSAGSNSVNCEIVGIVADSRQQGPEGSVAPEFFHPHPQAPTGSMAFVVRTAGDPEQMIKPIKDAIWSVDNKVTFYQVTTMKSLMDTALATRQLTVALLGAFALLAVTLACIGLYGVMSYSTSQRTHEIGIRMALGAQRTQVLGMVVADGLRMVLAGVAAGMVLALLLLRLLAKMLYGVSAADPVTYAGVAALLVLVALAACYLPARGATRVDPLVALRYE